MLAAERHMQPGQRYVVGTSEGASVRADGAAGAVAVHHLPQGTVVLVAEVIDGAAGLQLARIVSPAGWMVGTDLKPAAPPESIKLDFDVFEKNHLRIASGDHYGLEFPFTVEQLREMGAPFLTAAFRAAGTIAADNAVTDLSIEPNKTMGASESAFLTVTYEKDAPGLRTRLFVKFPPDKGLEYKYALATMSLGEVEMQRLANRIDLPFATAAYYFGDYSSATANYILITERIAYGVPPIEPAYRKGYDHAIPAAQEHYLIMAKALAGLVAAHKTGRLGYDLETVFPFARAARCFDLIPFADAKVDRLIDFVGRIAPHLFVEGAADPTFLSRWRADLLFGLEHKDSVIGYLHENVDYTGLCHPNLNLDNAWFWRDRMGDLQVGLIDWGGAGQMSIAQAMSGMLMMPIPESYLALQRSVVSTFVNEYTRHGGVMLDKSELFFQYKASVFSTAICTILSVVVDMLSNFSEDDYRSMEDRFDDRLLESGMYSAIVWIDNMLRDWLDDVTPGDACRQIVERSFRTMPEWPDLAGFVGELPSRG